VCRGGPPPRAPPGLGALLGQRRLRRVSGLICGGIIASFAHIAASRTVPGANDNLTGVATVLAMARALHERPVEGLRVLLVSTGAEESLMEGMRAFAQRHFPALDPASTHVLCVDCVGSPHLVLACAEGMLQVRDYDPVFEQLIAECAEELGVPLRRGFRMRLGTDGYLALRHGLPAGLLMSMNDLGVASNYHWPTDTPDRVDYDTLANAVRLCEAVIRRMAGGEA
jgi:Zn-dependent M28 family amino/carboxypeptidase